MARIAIIGPGAVGGVIAGWLGYLAAHTVTLCARTSFTELIVETPAPHPTLRSRPIVVTSPENLSAPDAAGTASNAPVDWVLVTTKAYDAAAAAAWFPRLVGPGTMIAILQNGVEHRERFAAFAAAAQLLPVVVDAPAERTAPGMIRQRGRALLTVPDDAAGRAFAALFAGTPVELALTADFKTAVWRKLCLNAAGVISALVMKPAGVMRDEALGDLSRAIVRECIAVGRAEGAQLPDDLAETVLQGYRNAPPDAVNSLHGDRIAGRPTEIDARNGVIVRLGRKHGIATPCNAMAVALLEAQSRA